MEALYKKLFDEIRERYDSLNCLTLRLQADYNEGVPFEQEEQDRLDLCYILDLFDTILIQLKKEGEDTEQKTDKGFICPYCNTNYVGNYDPDRLCEECSELFGHSFYSEL